MLALLFAGGLAYLWLAPEGITQAPQLTLTTLQGDKLQVDTRGGRPLLVTFWATTCPSCLKEVPHLAALYKELAPRGLEMIAVAMPYDPPNRVIAFSKQQQLPYPVALDVLGHAAQAFGNVRVTPNSFLIAPDGRVLHHQIGVLDMERIHALLSDLLDAPQ